MTSSVHLFGQYANCKGSSVAGNEEVMKVLMRRSKHLIATDVKAKGR